MKNSSWRSLNYFERYLPNRLLIMKLLEYTLVLYLIDTTIEKANSFILRKSLASVIFLPDIWEFR